MLSKNKAFGLIEVLVAGIILATGLLGIAILQQNAANLSRDSDNYATAVMLATEISYRMQANAIEARSSTTNTYTKSLVSVNATSFITQASEDNSSNVSTLNGLFNGVSKNNVTCYTGGSCDQQVLASIDLFEWVSMITNSLPNGKGVICLEQGTPIAPTQDLNCPSSPVTSPVMYTIKIRWSDTANTNKFYITRTVIPTS